MSTQDKGSALADQARLRRDAWLCHTDDGRPLDAAGGILAGIGFSLPAWFAAAMVTMHVLP